MGFIKVSSSEPCVICGRKDYCTRSEDGQVAKCMRVESQKPAKGTLGGWIHRLSEPLPVVKARPKSDRPKVDFSEVARECYHHPDAVEARRVTAETLGVSHLALERLGVGLWFDAYRNLYATTWPERTPNGKTVGIVRRYDVPVSDSGGNKLTMPGSSHGVYIPTWWHKGTGPIPVVEGGSDTAAILTIGLDALGRFTNVGGARMIGAMLNARRITRPIIVIAERDFKPDRFGDETKGCSKACDGCRWCWPGLFGARQSAKEISDIIGRPVAYRLPPKQWKDSREWLNAVPKLTASQYLRGLVK